MRLPPKPGKDGAYGSPAGAQPCTASRAGDNGAREHSGIRGSPDCGCGSYHGCGPYRSICTDRNRRAEPYGRSRLPGCGAGRRSRSG
jgi:hypothetical protein